MAKRVISHIKLGAFVVVGLAFLIMLLYIIGKNQNLFGQTFVLNARFNNVHGLMKGNTVRYAGINAGTVKDVQVINDSTIDVTMLIKTDMKQFIRKNARIEISTDGLMGNKLINIQSAGALAEVVQEGDILYGSQALDTDEMLKVLNSTNNDLSEIAQELKITVHRFNNSKALWTVLNDETLPQNIRYSLARVKNASEGLNDMITNLNDAVTDIRKGKGTIGQLVADTAIAAEIKDAIAAIRKVGAGADSLTVRITAVVNSISNDLDSGSGTVNALLNDKQMRVHLSNSIAQIETDAKALNEILDAVKNSFLFRGYFKRTATQKR